MARPWAALISEVVVVWIIVAVVVVGLGWLAWWTSGRSKALPGRNHAGDVGPAAAKSQWQINGDGGGIGSDQGGGGI